MRIIKSIVVFLAIFPFYIESNVFDLGERYFETIGNSRTVPAGVVTVIEQDGNGFMWFGTQNGLVRYDGYQFTTFLHDKNDIKSLAGDYILSIWSAEDGKIWVGSVNAGISVYHPETNQFTRYSYDEKNPNSLSNNQVWSIVGDSKGGIWVGTSDGLNYLEKNKNDFKRFYHNPDYKNSLSSSRIYSLFFQDENTLWIGSSNGVDILHTEQTLFRLPFENDDGTSPFKEQIVFKIFESSDKRIWIGTRLHGASWIKPNDSYQSLPLDAKEPNSIAHPWVFDITQPSKNEIWFGTFGGGITVYDLEHDKVIEKIQLNPSNNNSINMNDIGSLKTDNSGLVWIGTWGGGLNRYNSKNEAFRSFHHNINNERSLTFASILSLLYTQDGMIWAGTGGNGVDIIDPNIGLIDGIRISENKMEGLQDGVVVSLAQSDADIYWIGTRQGGLYQYNNRDKIFKNYSLVEGMNDNTIRTVLAADDGGVWAGTSNGLYRVRNNNVEKIKSTEKQNEDFDGGVLMMVKQRDGTLWIMTTEGLYVMPLGQLKIHPMKHDSTDSQSISSDIIHFIGLDNNDKLWVSTDQSIDRMISYENKQAKFESLDKSIKGDSLLLSGNLQFDEEGNAWNEQARLDIVTGHVVELDESDGVNIGGVWLDSSIKTKEGYFLFGGTNGILMMNPKKYQPWQYEPALKITKIKIDNKDVPFYTIPDVTLSEETKAISVEFSSLDYSAPIKNKYAYQLKGYDRDWIEVDSDHRFANYTNLDPGHYELLIRGSNRVGKWSDKIASLSIEQRPKWYQTFWFKIITVSLIILLIVMTVQLRLRQLRRQKHVLKRKVAKRTADILLLSEIGRELTSSLELDSVVSQVYKSLNKVLDAHVFLLGILKPEQGELVIPLMVENQQKMDSWSLSLDESNRPGIWCVNNKKEVVIQNDDDWSKYLKFEKPNAKIGNSMSTVVYQPLIINENVVGCMSIQSPEPNAYDKRQLDMIRILSSYTAIAVANALGFTNLEEANNNLQRAHTELEKLSLTDQLTGAHNRRFLTKVLAQEVSALRRNHYKEIKDAQNDFGFLLIDADFFKRINDEYGHEAGDKVLIQFVEVLIETCRESDWIVRWGGEEFLVVARFTHREELQKLAERIRVNINEHPFDLGDGLVIHKSCSIGVAAFPFIKKQFDLIGWEQTINLADIALYIAKENGRNAWVHIFEKDVIDFKTFYQRVNHNVAESLENHLIELESSIGSKLIINR